MTSDPPSRTALPGEGLDPARMPGHWVLAQLGKQVLRPGGLELTRRMLEALTINGTDRIIEFAPGMGHTARRVLEHRPKCYIAVERDPVAADRIRRWLGPEDEMRRVVCGEAQATNLPDGIATVVFGEAMLTMQPDTRRRRIVHEAFRLLAPGGRYGIHELGLQLNGATDEQVASIRSRITGAIHHQAYPMSVEQWAAMLEEAGFIVQHRHTAPMALLEPHRLIRDEGWLGAARFALRLLTRAPQRRRVLQMRRVFRELRCSLCAISLVAYKPAT